MSPILIALSILALAAFTVIVLVVAGASARKRRTEDIPPGMRPAYADEELETKVLERYMGWGLALTLFFAVFLPVYWLREPSRLNGVQQASAVTSFTRGQELYEENCVICHSGDLGGGGATSPYNPRESWPAPALNNIAARYEESRNVTNIREFIVATLHRGRPGTPMPTWGADYGGPLTDQQITDITDYVLLNQIDEVAQADPAANLTGADLFTQNCARCHGKELEGVVGPTLVGLFERHGDSSVMGILKNGIYLETGAQMPPWAEGNYQQQPFTDDALAKIIDYLHEQQPAVIPEGLEQYQTPGVPYGVQTGAPADDETEA